MIALYSGHQEDRRLTRGEACTIMEVDMATTGPRFIAMLENADLVEIERYPEHDKRKEFIKPTVRLVRAVETELRRLAVGIINCAEHFQSLEFLKGMDKSTLNKVPSGGPGPEPALVPAQWPPVDKGTPFKNGRPPPRRPRG